jgi:DNA invertase Pin-like site-specific DNA recombinase
MKAINVSRVSTEEQKEAGNSLPAQIERIDAYCKRKSFEVIKAFSFDESAYKEKRDDFDNKVIARIDEIIKKELAQEKAGPIKEEKEPPADTEE